MSGRFAYPIALDVRGRRAVVIGAEAVRQGKADALTRAGAEVVVRSETDWRPEDLDGAWVCVAASADGRTRDTIAEAARARGVLVNVMDDVANCDFAAPALVRRGDLAIAVSTGGGSPALARRIREDLEGAYGPEWSQLLDLVRELRATTRDWFAGFDERAGAWSRVLDEQLERVLVLIRREREHEAAAVLRDALQRAAKGEEGVGPPGPGRPVVVPSGAVP